MSERVLVAVFDHPSDLLAAVDTAQAHDLAIADVYSPYAIHGLDEALGWRASRLPWAGFAGGLAGLIGILWLQQWTSAVDWPLNVGGRPWNSVPAFVPVTFEMFVLGGSMTAVATLLVLLRLYPGRRQGAPLQGVTDDRFALVLAESNAAFDVAEVEALLSPHRPVAVKEWLTERGRLLSVDAGTSAEAPGVEVSW